MILLTTGNRICKSGLLFPIQNNGYEINRIGWANFKINITLIYHILLVFLSPVHR